MPAPGDSEYIRLLSGSWVAMSSHVGDRSDDNTFALRGGNKGGGDMFEQTAINHLKACAPLFFQDHVFRVEANLSTDVPPAWSI